MNAHQTLLAAIVVALVGWCAGLLGLGLSYTGHTAVDVLALRVDSLETKLSVAPADVLVAVERVEHAIAARCPPPATAAEPQGE